ncbi:MAG: hypothetical protein RDV41_13025, partial [Planctomycetota bacterium]|nr:hypothetical protein [Planctomycetota bacterium]
EDYLADFPFLYIRKDSDYLPTLLHAPRFAMVEVCGIVRNDFHNIPWIEVIRLKVTECGYQTEASLHAVVAGMERFQEKDWAGAIVEFRKALSTDLSNRDEGLIYKQLGYAQYVSGDIKGAHDSAHSGLRRLEDDPELRKLEEATYAILHKPNVKAPEKALEPVKPVETPEIELEPVPKPGAEEGGEEPEEGDLDTGKSFDEAPHLCLGREVSENAGTLRLERENCELKAARTALVGRIEHVEADLATSAARNVELCAELGTARMTIAEQKQTLAALGRKLAGLYRTLYTALHKDDAAAAASKVRSEEPLGPAQAISGRVDRRATFVSDDQMRARVDAYVAADEEQDILSKASGTARKTMPSASPMRRK